MKNIIKNRGLKVSNVNMYTFWSEAFPFVIFGMFSVLGCVLWALFNVF